MVASMLHKSGVSMGDRLLPGNVSNPDGHFEDEDFVELHEHLLKNAGTNWQFHDEVRLPENGATRLEIGQYLSRLTTAKSGIWGFKDPRATLFLDSWASQLEHRSHFVLVYRPWKLCIQSLHKRHSRELAFRIKQAENWHNDLAFWRQPELAARMWLSYNKRVLAFVKTHPANTILVSAEALFEGYDVIQAVNSKFKMRLDPVNNVVKESHATNYVSRQLQPQLPHSLVAEMDDLYEVLCRAANSVPASLDLQSVSPKVQLGFKRLQNKVNSLSSAETQEHVGETVSQKLTELQQVEAELNKLAPFNTKESRQVAEGLVSTLGKLDVDSWRYLTWQARILISESRWSEAITLLLKASAIETAPAFVHMLLGDAYLSLQQNRSSEVSYLNAVSKAGDRPEFRHKLGMLYQQEGLLAKAIEQFQHAIELNPANVGYQILCLNSIKQLHDDEVFRSELKRLWSAYNIAEVGMLYANLIMQEDYASGKALFDEICKRNLSGDSMILYLQSMVSGLTKESADNLLFWLVYHWEKLLGEELDGLFNEIESHHA